MNLFLNGTTKLIAGEPDHSQESYDYALRQICVSEGDLGYRKNLLEPYLPESLPDDSEDWDKHYDAKEIIVMQIHILDKPQIAGESLYLTHAETLEKDGEITRFVEVAEKALKIFPDHRTAELRKFLNRFHEKSSSEKRRENIKSLFLLDGIGVAVTSQRRCPSRRSGTVFSERSSQILQKMKDSGQYSLTFI